MALRTKILGTVCALSLGVLVASPAMADVSNFSAVLGAGYSNSSIDGYKVNDWTFAGTGAFDTNILWNMSLQGDISNQEATSNDGPHVGDFNAAISPFWRMDWGRVGATVGVSAYDYYGEFTSHAANYGVYAEWYLCPNVTLAVKGGGWTEYYGGFSASSGYVGGQATWYIMPDLAFSGTVDYTGYPNDFDSGIHETDYGVMAEWLVSETTPVSIYGGWTGTSFSHTSGTLSTWSVGLKLYLNQGDASTLVDRQRSGSTTWGTKFNPYAVLVDF